MTAPSGPTVAEWMTAEVRTVPGGLPADELEPLFVREGVSGFPVVDGEELVGVVTRSDLVRRLALEKRVAEEISPFFRVGVIRALDEASPDDAGAAELGELRVRDVMARHLVTIDPDQPLAEAARKMVDHHVHRVLVTDGRRLVGLISSLDVARWAAGRAARGDAAGRP